MEYYNKIISLVISYFLFAFLDKMYHLYNILNLYFLNFANIIDEEYCRSLFCSWIYMIFDICWIIYLKFTSKIIDFIYNYKTSKKCCIIFLILLYKVSLKFKQKNILWNISLSPSSVFYDKNSYIVVYCIKKYLTIYEINPLL